MDEGGLTPWIITILLILFADYIAVAETALSSVSRVRMKLLADHGNRRAAKVLDALEHFDRTISTILICTNIAHLGAASVVTVAVTRRWGLSAVAVSTFITSMVVFFVGEMLPKSIAKKYSEHLSLWCIDLLTVLIALFRPASALLAAIGNAASRLTKGDPEISVTEDEIYDIIEDMTEEGSLDEEHGDLISSALQFNDLTVESILTPRVDVVAIDINDDSAAILQQIRSQNHSRLPVYEGSKDNIIGILRIRRYIQAYLKLGDQLDLRTLLDKPIFVTESAAVDELLPIMSRERQNMAVVTDHHGGTAGIVTVEDILETLVGEIWDEDDIVITPIVALENGNYLVDAEEPVADVLNEIGFECPPEDEDELINTRIGEWVYDHFSSIPKVTDGFDYHGLRVTIAKMDHNRILKVVLRRLSEEEQEEGGAER
ncbi:MAG: HlyC/CorC family transporter [Lachnospiraceae bacterium]|nr:HlyC/CorC family transporter [Lachnospiraceae bacterium]